MLLGPACPDYVVPSALRQALALIHLCELECTNMCQSECLTCRQRGKEQRDSEKALLAGLQAEELQLETVIAGLKRQQAALSAIGAAMVHQCDPAFLPEFSSAQQNLCAAQNSCLQAVPPHNRAGGAAGGHSMQLVNEEDQQTSTHALVSATDQALV
jgi:hypothetical protein